MLELLSVFGIVRDLKAPPDRVLRNAHRLGARTIQRTAEELAARFNPERIALAIASTQHAPDLMALREALNHTRHRAGEALAELQLPHLPSREELRVQARAMFARTPSLDEIVNRGHEVLLIAIGRHLAPVPLQVSDQSGVIVGRV